MNWDLDNRKEPCRLLWPEETRSREQKLHVPTVSTLLAYLRNRVVSQCGLNAMRKEIAGRQRPVEALQVMANHVIS